MHQIPAIGSILLASTNPESLRAWYERAFDVKADADGFLRLGEVGLLIDGRDDVAVTAAEPARVIINLHVTDAQETARRLGSLGVNWVADLEYREDAGAWFGTVLDPDGNYLQIIELTAAYWVARRERAGLRAAGSLLDAAVSTRLPAQDLDRARRFYAEKLGLEPAETRPGGLRYQCRSGSFSVFESTGEPSGGHTQMAWKVDDVEAVVAELRGRGVEFEDIDVPGLRTVNGIVEVAGNYPSSGGTGERGAWFRDSEGNVHGIGQTVSN
ncbi:VOC family protein [Actinomadura sp. 9N407]|uniref:VOC family protein n=1 Tax=Actinomadura sp. 9N407 TaxID=3375154 RepID=UPI003792BC18